jgi:hypothetical protein
MTLVSLTGQTPFRYSRSKMKIFGCAMRASGLGCHVPYKASDDALRVVALVVFVTLACQGKENGGDVASVDELEEMSQVVDATFDDSVSPDIEECAPCVPNCLGKECGLGACGGWCGGCPEGMACLTVEAVCGSADYGECTSRQCGPDGMGDYCGQCAEDFECQKERCAPIAGACSGIPEEGLCMAGWVVRCQDGQAEYEECVFDACVVDTTGQAVCAEAPCLPDCFGRTCGDDGCGELCGDCAAGETCQGDLGVCLPTDGCGDIPTEGRCEGHTFLRCTGGVTKTEACLPQGRVCDDRPCLKTPGCRDVWPDTPCGRVPAWGHCEKSEGGHYFECVDGSLRNRPCTWIWHLQSCVRLGMEQLGCTPL